MMPPRRLPPRPTPGTGGNREAGWRQHGFSGLAAELLVLFATIFQEDIFLEP
jgi:hypothetical protein